MADSAKTTVAKGAKKAAGHPTFANMIVEAITKLSDNADRNGSSFQGIKKTIAETHQVDVEKQGFHIKKALKKLVETGKLAQPKGQGASGSFKLAAKPKPAKKGASPEKKPVAKKVSATKKTDAPKTKEVMPAAAATKKSATVKKATSAAKPKTVKKASAVAEPKPTTSGKKKSKDTAASTSSEPAKVGKGKTRAAPKIRLPKP